MTPPLTTQLFQFLQAAGYTLAPREQRTRTGRMWIEPGPTRDAEERRHVLTTKNRFGEPVKISQVFVTPARSSFLHTTQEVLATLAERGIHFEPN